LSDKGETIIRSIEAGSRASMIMMHHIRGVDPVHTLLDEHSKEDDIVFIVIYNRDGSVFEQSGRPGKTQISKPDIDFMLQNDSALKEINRKTDIFTFTKPYIMSNSLLKMHQMIEEQSLSERVSGQTKNHKIISIGLLSEEFDIARKQDVRHALFMGAILFLVGTAGLYFLFLYQKMRLTGATLADMKLYTDSVIESIPVSLVTIDANDRIVSCNQNTQEIFGYPLDELVDRDVHHALPGCSETIAEACGTSCDHSVECVTRDGRNIPLHISCSPLVNHNNENIGKVLIIRDMSSIKRMELQLERSRRMAALGKMAAGIAHEIRNPLGTLRGFAQFFGGQTDTGVDGKKYSALMVSEIDRLNQTVSGLLQFSRPREPQLQSFPLDLLVEKTVTLMKSDLTNHKVQFDVQLNSDIELKADPDLLLQVLMNLLKNSINATTSGGKISLLCLEAGDFIRIAITDDGCGMSGKERERMFDPFFSTTKMGTGLGLAVSHQIIEQHHGTFEVQTEQGRGTTITVVLPKED
ncbi:MAG: two-component system sensor histidine kinase NtrB, partial [Desulforhopalus sp.]